MKPLVTVTARERMLAKVAIIPLLKNDRRISGLARTSRKY
jgi:hypothetical protein